VIDLPYWAHSSESADKTTWQPLRDHLVGVADAARGFAAAFGSEDIAWITGLCHDLGKYSNEFQKRLEDPRVRVDHSTGGAALAFGKYGAVGRLIAYAVAGHHGGMPDGGGAVESSLAWRIRQKDIPDFSAYAEEVELPEAAPRPALSADTCRPGFTASFFVRMLFSCLVDADFLDTERFLQPVKSQRRRGPTELVRLEEGLAKHLQHTMASAPATLVNRKRAEVLQDCLAAAESEPGLFTLTVPTGGGKTLSSLAFALKHARLNGLRRVIYVIPFTSIIEQSTRVFRDAVGKDAVLEHHSNVVAPMEDPGDRIPSRSELAEENWDIPLIVTTNVQFFESLFSNRPSRCRKLHNVAGSVVILDEAQMLPVEMLRPCVAALCELTRNYRATVVLCSATQPALEGLFPRATVPTEITRNPSELYTSLRRVECRNLGVASNHEIAEQLLGRKQALCIVNTRRHAREIFQLLGKMDGHYHLSAALCPVHRSARLADIRARLSQAHVCRVVSTQLIEAGVHIDFPVVVRAVAGIDSIAQAAGRCNREGKLAKGEVLVFTPTGEEGMSHVWFRRTAAIASSILEREEDPLSLKAVHRYFHDLYFYEDGASDCGNRPSGLDTNGILSRIELGSKALEFPFREVADLFKVIGEDTIGVVVSYDDECKRLLAEVRAMGISRHRARRLQPYTVSLRLWEYRNLEEAGLLEEVEGITVLRDMGVYDDDYGLLASSASEKGGDAWIV